MKKFSQNKESLIWKKSNNVCAHCGKKVQKPQKTVDHVLPKSRGGTFDIRNLMPLCKECNRMRGSREVNPFTFYPYADKKAQIDAARYKKENMKGRTNWFGEVVGY